MLSTGQFQAGRKSRDSEMVSLASGTTLGHLISAIGGGLKSLGYDNYSVVVLHVDNFLVYAA